MYKLLSMNLLGGNMSMTKLMHVLGVGSQFFDFFKSPLKIWRYGGEQLDACTH